MLRQTLFGVDYSITTYSEASDLLIYHAEHRNSFGMSALAVHGLMECVNSPSLATLVNSLDLITPDGQPVRWALNSLFHTHLTDRVSGPDLTLKVLQRANHKRLKLFLYGSTADTLRKLVAFINSSFPDLEVCGIQADRFREATLEEDLEDIRVINRSGAHIVLVGRGCPRQERWVANHLGKVNAVMMAVGAAFDFHAGAVRRAPTWMQQSGLEWFYRVLQDPRRLWKRYLVTNSQFIILLVKYKLFQMVIN